MAEECTCAKWKTMIAMARMNAAPMESAFFVEIPKIRAVNTLHIPRPWALDTNVLRCAGDVVSI